MFLKFIIEKLAVHSKVLRYLNHLKSIIIINTLFEILKNKNTTFLFVKILKNIFKIYFSNTLDVAIDC